MKKKSLSNPKSTFWNEPRIAINNQALHGITSKPIEDFTSHEINSKPKEDFASFCIKKGLPTNEKARLKYYEDGKKKESSKQSG